MLIEILKALRDRDNLTHKELADKLDVDLMSWYRIRQDRQDPGLKFAIKALQIYPQELSHIPLSVAFSLSRTDQCGKHLVDISNGHILYVMSRAKRATGGLLTKIHKRITKALTFSPFKRRG